MKTRHLFASVASAALLCSIYNANAGPLQGKTRKAAAAGTTLSTTTSTTTGGGKGQGGSQQDTTVAPMRKSNGKVIKRIDSLPKPKTQKNYR